MSNKIMRAYVRTIDDKLRNLYIEREHVVGNTTIICSIYKNIDTGRYYCLTATVVDGEYEFSEDGNYSYYCSEEKVLRENICGDIISEITKLMHGRKQLLYYMSNSKEMPNLLHVHFNKELTIYYTINHKLFIATTANGILTMIPMVDKKEQDYLTGLLRSANITVNLLSQYNGGSNNATKRIGV